MPPTKRYQTGLVALFFFTWGSVFLARMSVLYLAPYIAPELHLSHSQIGLLASALALAWAASGLLFGAVSDRIGRRPVLLPTVFLFSIFSWLCGLARSFAELLMFRVLLGLAEGPTWPTMTSTIEATSDAKSRGRNIGIVVSAGALVGLALAPVLTTQIAARYGWRVAFYATGLPGIILGILIWKFVKEPSNAEGSEAHHAKPSLKEYVALLRYRNMLLCCVGAAGFMTWLFVMSVFAPLYITEVSGRSATLAGLVLGASGLGGFLWGWIFPWISDRVGRKPILIFVALLSATVPLTFRVPFLVAHPWLLAAAGFLANGGQGIAALVLVLVPTESVPTRVAATAIGLATLVGEIFGGALAPAVAGAAANKYGLGAPLWIASAGAILVLAASCFIKETAPQRAESPKLNAAPVV
ncbi:MAG TPA: MFS transporter [Candidatus Acidoferrum sp.]|nr:MFS transporter [Candidatus Acidoferrum sp.]